MARVPQAMSRIRKRDHSPAVVQPTDLERKPQRGFNGTFTSSARESKADGDMNSILKSRTEAGNAQCEIRPCQRSENVTHPISCVNRGVAAYIKFRKALPRVAWHSGPDARKVQEREKWASEEFAHAA